MPVSNIGHASGCVCDSPQCDKKSTPLESKNSRAGDRRTAAAAGKDDDGAGYPDGASCQEEEEEEEERPSNPVQRCIFHGEKTRLFLPRSSIYLRGESLFPFIRQQSFR
ncbi:hypothetical protein [Lignipirellula cremea]|uniref:hypothetical protein n=1 Tax=Lignipirellula cremea TaxID=2528010 RepID=UPI0011A4028C|nr:hypothetical protein [Lignipirellula cremea]